MEQKVARVGLSTTFQEAAELLVLTQASDLMVVDRSGHFVGVVSEGDLLRALIPDYSEVAASGGTMLDAFRLFEENGKDLAAQTIERLVIAHPLMVGPEDELLGAAAMMIEKMIRRLPVVAEGRFLGTVSRADLLWAVLSKDAGKG